MYISVILPTSNFACKANISRAKIQLLFILQAQNAYFFQKNNIFFVKRYFLSFLHFVNRKKTTEQA